MSFAIIQTGGKQYKVKTNEILKIEKINKEKSGKIAPIDYVNMNTDKSQLVLTSVWAVGIIGLFVRILQVNAF